MRFSTFVAAILPVGLALGEVIPIKVGVNSTLSYDPPSVNATVGDTLMFTFVAGNHTITQSTFASPCSNFTFANGSTGVDSGFEPVAKNATSYPSYSFTIQNTSTPLWFYCRQTGHCEKGMVFAVNAPETGNTYAAFKAKAESLAATSTSMSMSGMSMTSSSTAATTSTTKTSGAGALRVGGAGAVLGGVGLVAGMFL
ncbi:uncharacterized protein FIBRA_04316 [Fibroporia radiculosa]|uniref:Phytocyanin domain-containing protein n=1 Tax=Fibroporia radiculosa TaxID=599839 RepID=J4IA38_9APHY|nr:uncharacterized protein FIBRA_04316 [Fibroporia radiculosa]CCM02236.1 predicted protein [Fibroporia radiculosa]